ncbi:MAG: hypothetical protein V4723_15885 [Pseudomonadota bacterium]
MSELAGTAATPETQGLALLSKLHDILRRQKARIIDIEYMRANPVYFRHVLGLIVEADSADLRGLRGDLATLYLAPGGLFGLLPPPAPVSAPVLLVQEAPAQPAPASSIAASVSQKYVGRLR